MMRAGDQDTTVAVTCAGKQSLLFCSKGGYYRFPRYECKDGIQNVLHLTFGSTSGP